MNNYELAVNTAKKIQEDLEKFYIEQDKDIRDLREALENLQEMFVKLSHLENDNPIGFSDEEREDLEFHNQYKD